MIRDRYQLMAETMLELMVPLRIRHLTELCEDTLLDQLSAWVDVDSKLYDAKGQLIPWPEEMVAGSVPGGRVDHAGFGIQRCAEGLAAMAWIADGGVDWAGMHWCRAHLNGRRLPVKFDPLVECWQLARDGSPDDPLWRWQPRTAWRADLCVKCGRRWVCECEAAA